ncbi:MAG: hypothetical protein ACREQN_03075 [Candidatus Binataceae bacterium]
MMRTAARISLAAAALMLAGCIIPMGTVGGVNQATAQRLGQQIPTYGPSQLNGLSYIKVAQIGAWSCGSLPFGPAPRKAEVVTLLRLKAQSADANGITDVWCGNQATNATRGCAAPTSCTATAIKLERGGGSP